MSTTNVQNVQANTPAKAEKPEGQKKAGFLDVFITGSRKGVNMWINNLMPGITVGILLIAIINETGLLDIIGQILGPVMGIFGLPGEAAVLYIGSFMSMSIGIFGALPLAEAGILTPEHITILLPMILMLCGPAKVTRMAVATDVDGKVIKASYVIMGLCSILTGLLMRFIVLFL